MESLREKAAEHLMIINCIFNGKLFNINVNQEDFKLHFFK